MDGLTPVPPSCDLPARATEPGPFHHVSLVRARCGESQARWRCQARADIGQPLYVRAAEMAPIFVSFSARRPMVPPAPIPASDSNRSPARHGTTDSLHLAPVLCECYRATQRTPSRLPLL